MWRWACGLICLSDLILGGDRGYGGAAGITARCSLVDRSNYVWNGARADCLVGFYPALRPVSQAVRRIKVLDPWKWA